MIQNDPLKTALIQPSGARFYRCALQLSPFDYLVRHSKQGPFEDEPSYNTAIIDKCKELSIEVIAVTDHYRVQSAAKLWETAKAAGIVVLPGFEAVTKDGVHLLCLFDVDCNSTKLERVLGDCGIHGEGAASPTGKYDVLEFVEEARKWGAVCIAAHVASDGGLLKKLTGQSRINPWKSPYLLACSLPGPVSSVPEGLRAIIENKNKDYCRDRPIAILNAQDVNGPDDLEKPGASCWIKMSEVSGEGLRQAFLDPQSRIRLASDPKPEEHVEVVAVGWQGGFLDGQGIHLNENLNVLIGGRGTGKSTVVESLRYVLGLDALGEEARKAHEGIVRHVLKSGTKISLLVCSYQPAKKEYRIERTVPNPPIVRDEQGQVMNLTPQDVVPGTEVYGQHEISELTKSPEKLTRLLDRFVEQSPDLARRKGEFKRELERSRARFIDVQSEIQRIDERLGALPRLEDTLKRFQDAGVEDKLKDQSLLVREERVLKMASERISPFKEIVDQLRRELPIDRTFLSAKALEDLPGRNIIDEANGILERLSSELNTIADKIAEVLARANQDLANVGHRWGERKKAVQGAYENILRELQRSRIDGEEFIRLRGQIEELRPLNERRAALQRDLTELQVRRRNLLAEWEDTKAAEFRQIEKAAKKVSEQLANRVFIQVTFAGDRIRLFDLLREKISGRLSEALTALESRSTLSLKELADAMRQGREAIHKNFDIPPAQAERLASGSQELIMQVEELDLPPTTTIKLNVAAEGQPPVWQDLSELSTGQKATAILLLLLLESKAPLIVDQPEDDLDNRFITDGVVPKMREEKRRRQFIFATHNANIPVLGDAELILGLKAVGEAGQGHAEIPVEHMGSIDGRPVRELVEEVLEGGKEAFEMRRLKYGF